MSRSGVPYFSTEELLEIHRAAVEADWKSLPGPLVERLDPVGFHCVYEVHRPPDGPCWIGLMVKLRDSNVYALCFIEVEGEVLENAPRFYAPQLLS